MLEKMKTIVSKCKNKVLPFAFAAALALSPMALFADEAADAANGLKIQGAIDDVGISGLIEGAQATLIGVVTTVAIAFVVFVVIRKAFRWIGRVGG